MSNSCAPFTGMVHELFMPQSYHIHMNYSWTIHEYVMSVGYDLNYT